MEKLESLPTLYCTVGKKWKKQCTITLKAKINIHSAWRPLRNCSILCLLWGIHWCFPKLHFFSDFNSLCSVCNTLACELLSWLAVRKVHNEPACKNWIRRRTAVKYMFKNNSTSAVCCLCKNVLCTYFCNCPLHYGPFLTKKMPKKYRPFFSSSLYAIRILTSNFNLF